ncbi:unnamed protein product [Heligmosomoides polygyrus]|uniref:Peptidase_M1_N domain-containing protein n=1 Tax=Heligmosomoides polygyrus TaxID=6339 RepID=A0A183F8A4_HELPZ|nr:unnamed protein product [Heligmosomoides polygyrus]
MTTTLRWLFLASLLTLRASADVVDTGLSPHLKPISYDLTVKIPLLEPGDGFTASVIFQFELSASSSNITLHAKNLHGMKKVSVISSLESFEPILLSTRQLADTVEFTFTRPLPRGQYLLTVGEYSGRFTNGSHGVIQRNLTLFTTHLQPSFARQLLPCVDHPSSKASYRITVIHPSHTIAQSNTIAYDVAVVDSNWQKTTFAPTPPLPAYLVAFSVMPASYEEVSAISSDSGPPHRVWFRSIEKCETCGGGVKDVFVFPLSLCTLMLRFEFHFNVDASLHSITIFDPCRTIALARHGRS